MTQGRQSAEGSPTADQQLEELVEDIPPDGWWNDSTRDTYLGAAKRLVSMGMTPDDAASFLSNLWSACASEYGE